jgi:hypothetical protein
MIQLNLTDEEVGHPKEAVKRRVTELDHEIAHPDSMAFRDRLKRRRETVRKVIEKLPDRSALANLNVDRVLRS